jgi:hypothetical protein
MGRRHWTTVLKTNTQQITGKPAKQIRDQQNTLAKLAKSLAIHSLSLT